MRSDTFLTGSHHLHENAAHNYDGEYVGACVCELIVPSECELECDSETLIMCRSTTDFNRLARGN
jgi:hypothetical protein